MERFKQIQQHKEKGVAVVDSTLKTTVSRSSFSSPGVKIGSDVKCNNQQKSATFASGGKLAFSLKQKSKPVVPSVKLCEEDEEDTEEMENGADGVSAIRQKLVQSDGSDVSSRKLDVASILCLFQPWGKRCSMKELEMWHACYKSNLYCVVHALGINLFFKGLAAPPSPSDPAVKKAADRLASFMAKNVRQIEDITRQKNPGNTETMPSMSKY